MTRKERIQQRNGKIREEYRKLEREKPEWRREAIIKQIAAQYFLAKRTIEAIINREKGYAV